MARELPEVKLFIPGLLADGLPLVVGRPKLGKSFLMLQVAKALASGGELWGRAVRRAAVLYLALEDSDRRMKERTQILGFSETEIAATSIAFDAPRSRVW